jgi:hypothetical protein
MDHHMPAPSTVSLSALPQVFTGALHHAQQPAQRLLTLVFEQPREALWLDAPKCTAALKAWLRTNAQAQVCLITPNVHALLDAWPRMAALIKWYGHQFTALAPVHEHSAPLQGVVLAHVQVIYQRRDALDWHCLLLPRNAVAQRMADALLAYGAGASAQSLAVAGLGG